LNKEDIILSGLLELYALGLASPEETLQVEEWINQYPEIKQELDAIENSLETYAQANAIEPSSSVKDKIFSQITKEEQKDNNNIPSTISIRQNKKCIAYQHSLNLPQRQ